MLAAAVLACAAAIPVNRPVRGVIFDAGPVEAWFAHPLAVISHGRPRAPRVTLCHIRPSGGQPGHADPEESRVNSLATAPFATPLPTLAFDDVSAWEWPQPPFARRKMMTLVDADAQPCRVETPSGAAVEGRLLHFDTAKRMLRLRLGSEGEPLSLPFGKFRRLTLTTAWPLARSAPDAPVERNPTVAQERDYRIELAAGGQCVGRTMGHLQESYGLFLFTPLDGGNAVQRVFLPQAAFAAVQFGKSAEELAAERWIATPEELFAALEAQSTASVKPLGEALVHRGFVTHGMIERAVSAQGSEREKPLGEVLVATGLLSRADLQTALAHKMGYPLVDLARFPIDLQVARKLSQRAMIEHSTLPLLMWEGRLVVAVDDLARIPRLQALQGLAGLKVVPVLASRGRIALALASLPHRMGTDHWADNVLLESRATAPGSPPRS
jgi:hypothetical protein